jgi:hypothetical protein
MLRLGMAILLIIALSTPAFASCPHVCKQDPVDADGDGTNESILTTCADDARGTLLTCEVKVRCWYMPGAGRHCEGFCDGSACYYV